MNKKLLWTVLLVIACGTCAKVRSVGQSVPPIKVIRTEITATLPADSEMIKAVQENIDVGSYREIRVQLVRDSVGTPGHYLVQLFAKNSHRVDFAKIDIDGRYRVLSVQQRYQLQAADLQQLTKVPTTGKTEPDSVH